MPMYLIWIVMLAVLLPGIILFLHRSQQQNRREVIERSTPLAGPEADFRPAQAGSAAVVPPALSADAAAGTGTGVRDNPLAREDVPVITESAAGSSWLNQIKRLREKGDTDGALQLCEQHFPRVQAFQQAAVILRQQIRDLVEQHRPVNAELKQLYRLAVFADLYRSSNPHKPRDPLAAYRQIAACDFDYQRHGTHQLRLLTKSDIRHLEQLWGRPQNHMHAEEALGEQWLRQCH